MMQEMNRLVGARRTHQGGRPQKYFLDERGRQLIISGYSNGETLNSIARKLRVPRGKVSQWAVQLGLSRQSSRPWSDKEIAYLKRNFYKKDLDELAVRLKRPSGSVRMKAYRLGLSENMEYNKDNVADGLGVHENTVSKWVEKGWLKGKKRGDSPNDKWQFLDKNIRDFILAHPDEINPKRMDWLWVVDILAGENGIGRLDQAYELSESQEGESG